MLSQRTQLDHPYSLAEKHPAQFAASIIEKLRAVKRQADSGDRLHRAQQEDFPVGGGCSGSSVAPGNNLRMAAGATGPLSSSSAALPGPPMPMTTDSAEKFVGLGGEEVSSQSILDEHVSRVFDSPQAQTPQRSTSPRRRAAVPASPYAVLGHQPRHRKVSEFACHILPWLFLHLDGASLGGISIFFGVFCRNRPSGVLCHSTLPWETFVQYLCNLQCIFVLPCAW